MKTSVLVSVHKEDTNTWQSGDFYGYKDFSSETEAENFLKKHKILKVSEEEQDQSIGIKVVYLKPFAYNEFRSTMEELFVSGHSDNAQKLWNKQEKDRNESRKNAGFVIFKNNDDLTVNDLRGALSKSLTEEVEKYISHSTCVFGYLGHQGRKLAYDKIIENIFDLVAVTLEGEIIDQWQLLGTWLTSSDARHWMDANEDDTNEEFEEAFLKKVGDIVYLGYVYGLEEHEGTLQSTMSLLYENAGKLNIAILY